MYKKSYKGFIWWLVTVVSCAFYLLGWPWWIDFTFSTVGLIAAAFRTMPIKL